MVVQYGIPREVPTTLQRGGRGGRGGRNSQINALFLIMFEMWAIATHPDPSIDFTSDPDHPNVVTLGPHSTKQARTGGAILDVVQCTETCMRLMFANYLADNSPDGTKVFIWALFDNTNSSFTKRLILYC